MKSGRSSVPVATPAMAMNSILRGAGLGFLAALFIGIIEGLERAISLGRSYQGPTEGVGVFALVLGYLVLLGVMAGALGGVAVAVARAVERRATVLHPRVWHAIWGAGLAVAALGWIRLALTLTTRFDSVIARWPQGAAIGILVGASIGLLWPASQVARYWQENTPLRVISFVILLALLVGSYLVNLLFAPQSSMGVHVLLDTAMAGSAVAMAWLLPRIEHRSTALSLLVVTIVMGVWVDHASRSQPRITTLVKLEGTTSRRVVQLFSRILDWDRDGTAPAFLVGGFDGAPGDPLLPEPILSAAGNQPVEPVSATRRKTATSSPEWNALPDVLLITLDACRVDVLPLDADQPTPLGELQPATPNLSRLAARSAVFETCYSHASGTEDSFHALFAGRFLPGLLRGVEDDRYLPSQLARAGYRTQAFIDVKRFHDDAWGWSSIDHRQGQVNEQIDDAVAFLADRKSERPGFAWFHFMSMHSSVLNPFSLDSYLRMRHLERYAAGLAEVDSLVGRLLDGVRDSGRIDRTLVILSADHGEALGARGYFHHNLTLYEPEVRVPLWVSGPHVVPGPRASVVAQVDLYHTILEVAHRSSLRGSVGRSLWPELSDPRLERPTPPIYLFLPKRGFSRRFSHYPVERGQAALIDPGSGHKVIVRFDRQTVEYYDLRDDPEERFNLIGQGVTWTAAMRAQLDSTLRFHARTAPSLAP